MKRKKFFRKVILGMLLAFTFNGCSAGEVKNGSKEQYIARRLQDANKPGLAAAVVDKGKIKEIYCSGYSNIEKKIRVTDETVFNVGSISKIFTSIAIMQLVEGGKINLDEDINRYLDFEVKNPYYPKEIITVRMLLTHTSTIDNNWFWVMNGLICKEDSDISIEKFIKGYLGIGGKYYHKENFINKRPEEKYFSYSNTALVLASYIVECVSKKSFEEYCREKIFLPLNMKSTSFLYKNLKEKEIAIPYDKFLNFYISKGYYNAPFFPAGFLKSSILDMSNLMIMMSNEGKFNNNEILSKKAYLEMIKSQDGVHPDDWDNQGLIFQYKNIGNYKFVGHTGGLYGISAVMYYCKDEDKGVILLMNGTWKDFFDGNRMKETEIREIFFKLFNGGQ